MFGLRSIVKRRSGKRVLCILGMHRSGTSFLTGSLQQAGLCLGDHSTWNPFNRRGNRENPAINALHDDLLAANGGSWHSPPEQVRWGKEHIKRARQIIAGYPRHARWGFKDPKTLPALSGWQSLLGEMDYIGIFRHPTAVAYSLMERNNMPLDRAYALWSFYNRLLLSVHDQYGCPLLNFDWDEETLHDKLNGILPDFGMEPIVQEQRFFTDELRHHIPQESAGSVPRQTRELYEQLENRVI